MTEAILEIARHELAVAMRTKRAVVVGVLYLTAALGGGLAYVLLVRLIEKQALQLLIDRGQDPATAAQVLSLTGEQAYQQLVAWFADLPPIEVSGLISASLILPALLWGSLAFLPYLVVLTSYDQIAADTSSRSLCYSVLRAPRAAILLGKFAAQTVLFFVLTVAASLLLVLAATLLLKSFDFAATLLGLARVWAVLLPFGMCYLGLSAFCSASVRQPINAAFMAVGLMVVLRLLGYFGNIPAETGGSLGLLRYLHLLSPAGYHSGLWRSGFGPLASVGAYLVFAALFLGLAIRRLEARDL